MATVTVRTTDAMPEDLLAAARLLMDVAFEGDYDDEDWEHGLGGHHVVVSEGPLLLAHASVVPRRIRVGEQCFRTGYVESVAASPTHQRAGHGSAAMTEINRLLHEGYELGALGTGRHSFYERLGWERWQGRTFVRDGEAMTRTPEDDDGVMVLRFGPSAGIDLAGDISCETRPGDDW